MATLNIKNFPDRIYRRLRARARQRHRSIAQEVTHMLEQAIAGSAREGSDTAGLDALLERVERGERIVITRAGRVVATLGPPLPGEGGSVDEAIGEILRLRRTRRLGQGVTVRDLIDEGRR